MSVSHWPLLSSGVRRLLVLTVFAASGVGWGSLLGAVESRDHSDTSQANLSSETVPSGGLEAAGSGRARILDSHFAEGPDSRIRRGEYFFGEDPGFGRATELTLVEDGVGALTKLRIHSDALPFGTHHLTIRFLDLNGHWSVPVTKTIVRLPTLPVTHFNWALLDGEEQLGGGIEVVDPARIEFSETLATGVLANPRLKGRSLTFQASLVLANQIPVTTQIFDFELEDVPPINRSDRDGDGLPDEVETNTGLFVSVHDTGTDPDNPDSDGDGLPDGIEVLWPMRPNVDDADLTEFLAERTSRLALGAPVLSRDENGDFVLRLGLLESSNLEDWIRLQLPSDSAGVDLGEAVIKIPGEESAAMFYLIEVINR